MTQLEVKKLLAAQQARGEEVDRAHREIAARPAVGRLVKRPHVNMGHGNGWDR